MRLYHETDRRNVASILSEGFRDGGPFGDLYGVCVADRPPGFRADWVRLAIETDLSDEELEPYGWNKRAWLVNGYREWCVPAERLNEFPRKVDP